MTCEYVSIQEAAAILKCSPATIQRYIAQGLLDRYRLRERYIRVRRDQVNELSTVDPALLRIA